MASAILAVLYPERFTVYDERVCGSLKKFKNLKNLVNFERQWSGYQDFKREVEQAVKRKSTLRDKDRYLWGKSLHDQLKKDIEQGFK